MLGNHFSAQKIRERMLLSVTIEEVRKILRLPTLTIAQYINTIFSLPDRKIVQLFRKRVEIERLWLQKRG